jgi:hypothetical protein
LGDESGIVKLRDEIIEIVVGLKNHAAAAPAVAAAGAALGAISLAQESDTPFAAVAGTGIDFYFIDEQKKISCWRAWPRSRAGR